MPRMEPLTPPYGEPLKGQFEAIMKGAEPLALFRTVAKSERAWRKFTGGSLLDRGPLSLRDREILIDRVCALNGCEYEWGVHVSAFAQAAGLTPAQVEDTVAAEPRAENWTAAELALIATADALNARASLSADEFARLRGHYDEAQVLEVLLLCGFYRTVAYLANGLDLPLEPGAARFPMAA